MLKSRVIQVLIVIWIMILIVTVIIVSISNENNAVLIETDYYQKGIAYNSVIEAKRRVDSLGEAFSFSIDSTKIQVTIPSSAVGVDSVVVECMRYNDLKDDRLFILKSQIEGEWGATTIKLTTGVWLIKMWAYSDSSLVLFVEERYHRE
ncbi:MAG: FixH family protein [Fibrobacterales bacterium]